MDEDQRKAFAVAAEPLIKWLNENTNPHATVLVTNTTAELLSSEVFIINKDHLKD